MRSEEHTSELQSLTNLVCRLLLEKKKKNKTKQQEQNTKHRPPHTPRTPRHVATHALSVSVSTPPLLCLVGFFFFFFFFFLMIRRPPKSPLFPSPPLFRSADAGVVRAGPPAAGGARRGGLPRSAQRSEEHTSELQSLTNLVCRLLLEKK